MEASGQTSVPHSGPGLAPLLALVLLLLLGAVPLSFVAAGDGVLPGDVVIARAIQDPGGSGVDRLARAVSWVGATWPSTAVLAFVAALLLVRGGRRAEVLLIITAAAIRALNQGLKALVDSPRPTPDLLRVIEQAHGLGFPSGHASGAVLYFGVLAVVVPSVVERPWLQRVLQASALLMVIAVGLARVRVGAHWPSDVLGGYLWGGVLLVLLLVGYRAVRR